MNDPYDEVRPRLFGVAYGILGSFAEAEDVVQDTWIAWSTADHSNVRDPHAYLVRTVTHRALNAIRAQRNRRESYVGPWLPEPVDTGPGPEQSAEVADAVTFALLVMMEQLSPLERAAFVLRVAFDVPSAEIGRTLQRSPAAVRQLVSRARAHLAGAGAGVEQGRSRYAIDPAGHRRVAESFVAAMRDGDTDGVLRLLAPDVTLVTDGGGQVQAALRPIVGADNVIRFFTGLAARYPDWAARLSQLNHLPGLVVEAGGTVFSVHLGIRDGIVTDSTLR